MKPWFMQRKNFTCGACNFPINSLVRLVVGLLAGLFVGPSFGRMVGRSEIIAYKDGQLHVKAPIDTLLHQQGRYICT